MNIDFIILDWIQGIRTPFGDVVMPWISVLGDAGLIWILLAIVLLVLPDKRKSGVILLAALIVDLVLCNGILKNLVARIRPYDINTSIQLLIKPPVDYSFPSGHTAASFASVTALCLAGEQKLWKPALAIACLIAFSRMYLYVHYPTDILGGIITGIAAGFIGYRLTRLFSRANDED